MTSIKLDRRKLRPRAITTPTKPKKGMNAWKRHNVFKTYLNEYKDDIETLIKAGSTVTQIAEQLAEAGLPTITNKTLSKHLKEILPKAYSEYLSRNRKQQQLNNFTCPLSNSNNLSIQQNNTTTPSQVTTPTPPPLPTQAKEIKEEQKQKPVITPKTTDRLKSYKGFNADINDFKLFRFSAGSLEVQKVKVLGMVDNKQIDALRLKLEAAIAKMFNRKTLNTLAKNLTNNDISTQRNNISFEILLEAKQNHSDYLSISSSLKDAGFEAALGKTPTNKSLFAIQNLIKEMEQNDLPTAYLASVSDVLNQIDFSALAFDRDLDTQNKAEHILSSYQYYLIKAVEYFQSIATH